MYLIKILAFIIFLSSKRIDRTKKDMLNTVHIIFFL